MKEPSGDAEPTDRGSILAELRGLGFRPSRRRGQNFLFDRQLLSAFLADAGVPAGGPVLEVGAGAGTLTRALIEHGCPVLTVEIDDRLVDYLRRSFASDLSDSATGDSGAVESGPAVAAPAAQLFHGDVLAGKNRLNPELEEAWLGWSKRHGADRDCWLISNLPYAVATPVLQLVTQLEHPQVAGAGVLVQTEVAERWVAREGSSAYGSISVWLQLLGSGRITRAVKAHLFSPPPQVESSFYVWERGADYSPLEARAAHRVARALFLQRRKMVRVLLKEAWDEMSPDWEEWGVRPDCRPGDISPDQYLNLARGLSAAPRMCEKLGFLPLRNL